jgi:hypothetical protein
VKEVEVGAEERNCVVTVIKTQVVDEIKVHQTAEDMVVQ